MRKFLTYFLLYGMNKFLIRSLLFIGFLFLLLDFIISMPLSALGMETLEEKRKNPRYLLAVEAYENEVILLDTTYFQPLDYQEVCTYLKSQSIKLADPPSKNFPAMYWRDPTSENTPIQVELYLQNITDPEPRKILHIILEFTSKPLENPPTDYAEFNQLMSNYSPQLAHLPTTTSQDFPEKETEKWLNSNLATLRSEDTRHLTIGNYGYHIYSEVETSGWFFKTYQIKRKVVIWQKHENLLEKTGKTTGQRYRPQPFY